MIIPAVAMIIGCVLYGQAGAHPDRWSWATIVIPYHMCYFAFLGANLVGIAFAVDSFPAYAGPTLLLICAGRGFISFGLSYATVPIVERIGHNGAMNIFAIICGVFSGGSILVYVFGKKVRTWATKHMWQEE